MGMAGVPNFLRELADHMTTTILCKITNENDLHFGPNFHRGTLYNRYIILDVMNICNFFAFPK